MCFLKALCASTVIGLVAVAKIEHTLDDPPLPFPREYWQVKLGGDWMMLTRSRREILNRSLMTATERTWVVRRASCKRPSQWRLGFCHLARLTDKTAPNKCLPARLCLRETANEPTQAALGTPVKENGKSTPEQNPNTKWIMTCTRTNPPGHLWTKSQWHFVVVILINKTRKVFSRSWVPQPQLPRSMVIQLNGHVAHPRLHVCARVCVSQRICVDSNSSTTRTLEKSGGGFFPLHRLDKHHTALRVMDSRDVLLSNLQHQTSSFQKLAKIFPTE